MLLAAGWVPLAFCGVAAAADDGQIAFNNHCRNCHSFKAGDNRIGPSLHGIVGQPAGQVKGYGGYSGALEGITWDEATLDKFIADPASVAPGTSMTLTRVEDSAVRKQIIEFLKSTGGS
jgi:cytochrome c